MNGLKSVSIFICAFFNLVAVNSSARTARSADGSRLTREIFCIENLEYPHNGFCCRSCDAGYYVKKSCERAGERGVCEPCEKGTYTEHPNGLPRCLPCTSCRKDQVVTQVCTSTKDRECQCKAGTFCVSEQACEVCKKCTKCKADEEVVKNCTTTSNSLCRKKPHSTQSTDPISVVVPVVFLLVFIFAISLYCWKKQPFKNRTAICRHPGENVSITVGTMEETQNRQNAGLEMPEQELQPFLQGIMLVGAKPCAVDEEDRGLGDSLPNTTSSSQMSLSSQPIVMPTKSPHPSPKTQRQPIIREDGSCRRLIPLNGEESLIKAFDIFEKNLAHSICNKFFRLIGLSDNTIDDPNYRSSNERVYRLLKSWIEKKGLAADINDLIRALLDLDQRLSAENVIQEVVDCGYFRFENEGSG